MGNGGIGFFGLLGIVFIILKLTGVIAWGWIWVLTPVWIPTTIGLVILLFIGLIALIARIVSKPIKLGVRDE